MADAPCGHLLHEGVVSRRRGRTKEVTFVAGAKPTETKRPLRVARMLALAHQCEALIAAGVVADRAELARVLGFTRARVTQLLDLTLLAPDIQEEILNAQVDPSRETVTERLLRGIIRYFDWNEQRAAWSLVRSRSM